MEKINISEWNRKEHFEFFSKFDEPYFGVTVNVDVSKAYQLAKDKNWSFFMYYHFVATKALNKVENLRYRIIDGEVYDLKKIDVSTTILREDKTFGFSYIPFVDDFEKFSALFIEEVAFVKKTSGLNLNKNIPRFEVIHYSTIPWIEFKSISHATNFNANDSVPKITFGKIKFKKGKWKLPMSIHVHHGLADAYHVSLFIDLFQKLLNQT